MEKSCSGNLDACVLWHCADQRCNFDEGEQRCVFAIAHKIGVALFVVLFIQKTVSKVK